MIEVTLSPFFFAAAAVAAIPWWTVTVTRPSDFPWYDAISIYGAELLGVFLAGLCTTVFAWSDHLGSSVCRACGAPTTFRGRHFDPLGSRLPHWKDLAILAVFACLNAACWLAL